MRILMVFLLIFSAKVAIAQNNPAPFASFDRASPSELYDPHDLEFGPQGNLYIADKNGARIVVMDPDTLEIIEVLGDRLFPGIHDISFGPNGGVAISVTGLSAVAIFEEIGGDLTKPTYMLPASRTEGVLWHTNGRVYATSGGTAQVLAYEDGKAVAVGDGPFGSHDIEEGANGNIWVADNNNRQLLEYTPDLALVRTLNHDKYGFVGPRYLDVDGLGRLVVADQDAHRILLIDPDGEDGGTLLGAIGTGSPGEGPNLFDDPEGVAVRGNNFYFSDSDNNRIVKYTVVVN